MNESISRAAGSEWGQELPPEAMEELIRSAGRVPRQRTTTYGAPPRSRCAARSAQRRSRSRSTRPCATRACDARCDCCVRPRSPADGSGRPSRHAATRTRSLGRTRRSTAPPARAYAVASASEPRQAACASTAPAAWSSGSPSERRARRSPAAASPVQPSPWPTSRCSGSKRAEHVARRREPEQQVDARRSFLAGRTGSCRPPRRRRASAARPPERVSRQRPTRFTRIDSNGLSGNGVRRRRRAGRRARPRPRRSPGCAGRGAGERRPARRAPRARESAGSWRTGSTSQTRPSAASAWDVRVAGSSTIHEKPCAPRSSQKRMRHGATVRAAAGRRQLPLSRRRPPAPRAA